MGKLFKPGDLVKLEPNGNYMYDVGTGDHILRIQEINGYQVTCEIYQRAGKMKKTLNKVKDYFLTPVPDQSMSQSILYIDLQDLVHCEDKVSFLKGVKVQLKLAYRKTSNSEWHGTLEVVESVDNGIVKCRKYKEKRGLSGFFNFTGDQTIKAKADHLELYRASRRR